MKRRRGRRGFWWWSWLLALVTLGAVVGGYYLGKKKWEEAPKDYISAATLSFQVRPPFDYTSVGMAAPAGAVTNANEAEVIRETRSDDSLGKVVSSLDLSKEWGLGVNEAVALLRKSIELDLNQETGLLSVIVVRHNPEESAEIANAVAESIPPRIKSLDDTKMTEAMKRLELELQPYIDEEMEARTGLQKALATNDVTIKVAPGVDLGAFLEIPEVLAAKVEWDSARENLTERAGSQSKFKSYWMRAVRPSLIKERAVPPPTFAGPEPETFQREWALYGLTAGMVLGSLLMLICWKLFP